MGGAQCSGMSRHDSTDDDDNSEDGSVTLSVSRKEDDDRRRKGVFDDPHRSFDEDTQEERRLDAGSSEEASSEPEAEEHDEHEMCFDVERLRWGDGHQERLVRLGAAACGQGHADLRGLQAAIVEAESAGVRGQQLDVARAALRARLAQDGKASGTAERFETFVASPVLSPQPLGTWT